MEQAQAEMPRYQCHKQVWALPIREVRQSPADHVHPGGSWELVPGDDRYAPITVSHEWYLKHTPQPGGYYVVYADGYKSYSPASAFEEGYTLLSEKTEPAHGCRLVEMSVGIDVGSHWEDWILAHHADGQWVSVAKLQPFGLALMRAAAAKKA